MPVESKHNMYRARCDSWMLCKKFQSQDAYMRTSVHNGHNGRGHISAQNADGMSILFGARCSPIVGFLNEYKGLALCERVVTRQFAVKFFKWM